MLLSAPHSTDRLHTRLLKFLSRPQRHRLLHGFPLAASMPHAKAQIRQRALQGDGDFCVAPDPARDLLVGVLPHPFCNPKIQGCGFCTFPHESFSAIKSAAVVQAVIQELQTRQRVAGVKPAVQGLYFGGGTANLTPAVPFRNLARKLAETFDFSQAEVSLEGVPAYFVRKQPLLIDVMQAELPARHFRISMGIQTFSERRLEEMGRLAFGRPETFAEAVHIAQTRGLTTSGDLLCNLPGQSRLEMLDDVRRAIEIGLDQICLYHLVMFRGLGTAWSKNENLLAALPTNEQAVDNWLVLREYLLTHGFQQTTLTNFERVELAKDERRYRYELMSFEPDRYQMLGFGPAGISYASAPDRSYAIKTMNPESSPEYVQATRGAGPIWNRYYQYTEADLKLLHLTRRLAALKIEKERFQQAFGFRAWESYAEPLALLLEEGLLSETADAFLLTPRGMFFSDSIAGLFALNRYQEQHGARFEDEYNDNTRGHM